MADLEKVLKGLKCCRNGFCFACPYNDVVDDNVDCKQKWADDALALLKAYKRRRELEVHNISNVDIPYGVTEAQFQAVMYNVVTALEHTDRGESWPYDDERGGVE